ncbi:hypothetical protein K474DRAFT_1706761 [Panus rudis PR-1116 ss-1]|nr:hypothetical protein K474DRAFT_1706761 [Panus rudis PR-1116 ss-1]
MASDADSAALGSAVATSDARSVNDEAGFSSEGKHVVDSATCMIQSENSIADADGSERLERDSEYYFDDQLITFAVERKLFRVHRYFLVRDSEFFRDLFSIPSPPGEIVEGTSDDRPIRLEGVKIDEFRCLLRFFYDSTYGCSIITLEDWISLLSISTRYIFTKIRDLAVLRISTQSAVTPIQKITLAHQFDIPQWIPPALVDLCKRQEPIDDEEAECLGIRTVVKIAQARELARDRRYVTWTPRAYHPYDRVYSYNDRGILDVVSELWPEYKTHIPDPPPVLLGMR